MSDSGIDREFYDAIVNFEKSEESQDHYYEVMDSETGKTGKDGKKETVRDRILKTYGLSFQIKETQKTDGIEKFTHILVYIDKLHGPVCFHSLEQKQDNPYSR